MNEKKPSSLIVFEKKEVALIFALMVVAVFTAFVMGVKLGKSYAMKQAGFVPKDAVTIDLKSEQEELVEKETKKSVEVDTMNKNFNKLEEEFNKLNPEAAESAHGEKSQSNTNHSESSHGTVEKKNSSTVAADTSHKESKKDNYKNKFTIQLGSYKTIDEAQKFADGFRIRGYDPIISEVEVSGRGLWFRVSLGAFETLQQTKDFIKKEASLFHGQDHVIGKFE